MTIMNRNKYEVLIDALVDYALFLLDAGGRIISWNPGAIKTTGYLEEEAADQSLDLFYYGHQDKADPEKFARLLSDARAHARAEDAGWWRRKDGTAFWANCVIDTVKNDGGELIGFACALRDLTERKVAEDNLQHSEQQFRLLVQGVGDCAIYMLDTNGYVTSWNTGAERIKGYTCEEVLGKHLDTFYTLQDRAEGVPQQALHIAAQTGRYESEGWRVRKDGSSFWANAIIDRIDDDEGHHVGFAKVTRDITQRHDAEVALAQAREALFQSQKLESIGQLTGGVAHDFNNLLMAIISSLELLSPRVISDHVGTNLVANAMAGAKRGAALTKRMLAFARKQELKPQVIDAKELVNGVAGLLQRSAGPTIPIDMMFPLALPNIFVDGNQLELALLNLVMNAKDAMGDSGHILIGAKCETITDGHRTGLCKGEYICLSVSDNGSGMDKATLDRAMEPFFTTKGIGKGTGLGLSMVHGLAEQSGGRLIIRSDVARGTIAEIWLPQADTLEVDVPQQTIFPALSSPTSRSCTILVVDDDPLIAMTMSAVLDDLGHHIIEVNSAKDALAVINDRQDIDLMITDYAMPVMNGLQLAEEANALRPKLPVIMASGFAELPRGALAHVVRLAKPFGRDDLAKAVDRALENVA